MVGCCSDCVESVLPGHLIGNATCEVATIIAVDGVAIDSDESVVGLAEGLCG